MSQEITIKIDGKNYQAQAGETVLEIARQNGIDIPSLCYHSDLKPKQSCRLCLIEIKGINCLQTSCTTKACDGMEIRTRSKEIDKARQINLELLFAQHEEECSDCVWLDDCRLLKLARAYKVDIPRFKDRKASFPTYQFGDSLIFDSKKCIDCGLCVEMCQRQGVNFMERKKNGNFFQIEPSQDERKDCIYCGQCLVHCPAGAFEAVGEYEDIEKPFNQKDKKVVFQFAPSIRVSIGEEFGLDHGSVVTEQLVGAIKELGVERVFDVSVGADVTTVEEAKELIHRMRKNENMPMFTSCCPGWVRYVEYNYPEFIKNLTTVRSPQIIMGGLIKKYWAQKVGINPEDIYVVSVMPCVAKKSEIERPELEIDGVKPIDQVMTTRELARLFKRKNINLAKAKKIKPDCPLGEATGAGVIYGASGGVMESALRSAAYQLTGKKLEKLDFEAVRGNTDIKTTEVEISGKKLKIAVVNGNGNALKILQELKGDPTKYDYVEVMACPGGCIGGGGQPMPVDDVIRQKRIDALYQIDKGKEIRMAEDSETIKELYDTFLNDVTNTHQVCHTHFYKQEKNNKVLPKVNKQDELKKIEAAITKRDQDDELIAQKNRQELASAGLEKFTPQKEITVDSGKIEGVENVVQEILKFIKPEYQIITLDGLSGAGKSTTAKMLAQKIDAKLFSLGEIFRYLTYLRHVKHVSEFIEVFENLRYEIVNDSICLLDDKTNITVDMKQELRDKTLEPKIPQVAKNFQVEVIKFIGQQIRELKQKTEDKIVLEGRAFTLDYLPTDLEITLVASVEVRAARRFKQVGDFGSKH